MAQPTAAQLTPVLIEQFKNKSLPRGIRNNNPGNIDYNTANMWLGMFLRGTIMQVDPTAMDSRFCQFVAPEFGIRAALMLFRTYQRKYNKETVREIISRWAPPNENNTEAYVAAAAKSAGLTPNSVVNFTDEATAIGFVKAVVAHENGKGQYYSNEVYKRAFALTK